MNHLENHQEIQNHHHIPSILSTSDDHSSPSTCYSLPAPPQSTLTATATATATADPEWLSSKPHSNTTLLAEKSASSPLSLSSHPQQPTSSPCHPSSTHSSSIRALNLMDSSALPSHLLPSSSHSIPAYPSLSAPPHPPDPPRRNTFSSRNKASLCISTSNALPHRSLVEIDHSCTTPLSAPVHHFLHSPRPLSNILPSSSSFISPPPTASTSAPPYPSLSPYPHHIPHLSSSSSSASSEEALFVSSQQDPCPSISQFLPAPLGLSPLDLKSDSPSHHLPHPSHSSSSVGPNVAGRIGVGGNLMVDPHHNSSTLAQKGSVGAGAFVYKVYNMLLDPSFQNLISFNPNGQSFTVTNVQDFSKVVLPKHFKHNNFSSFVRQLNMYGFHKVNKTPRGQRGNENSASWEFVHPKFQRGRPDLLEQIRRKPLETEAIRKDGVGPMNLTSLFIHPHPSFSTSPGNNDTSIAFSSRSYPLSPAAPPPPSSTPAFSHSPIRPLLPQHEKPPKLSPPFTPSNLVPGDQPPLPLAPPVPYSHHLSHSHKLHNPSYHSLPVPRSAPFDTFSAQFGPTASLMDHHHLAQVTSSRIMVNPLPSAPVSMPVSASRSEMLGRFDGLNEGYRALHKELRESKRRQDLLFDLCGQMYRSLEVLTNGNVGFAFPSQELLAARPSDDGHPIFKITQADHSNIRHPSLSVGHSPALSDFPHHPIRRSLASLDPANFGMLSLNSPAYPASTSPLSPFSTAVKTPLPPSPDYQQALQNLMDAGDQQQQATSNGLVIGTNGLLGVAGNNPAEATDSMSEFLTQSLSNQSFANQPHQQHHQPQPHQPQPQPHSPPPPPPSQQQQQQQQQQQHKGKKRPATGSMDLTNAHPLANSSARRV